MNPKKSNEKVEEVVEVTNENSTSFDDLTQDMVGETPEVQQHVVDNYAQKEAEKVAKQETLSGQRDSAGNIFDPEMHMIDDNGEPRLTKTGRFRKIPKATRKLNNPADSEAKRQAELEAQHNIEAESRIAAETVQGLKRKIYDNLLDYHYDDSRHKLHVDVTTTYFVDAGGMKLSPLHTLMLVEGSMIVEAFGTPKGQEKARGIKQWIAHKFVKFKFRKGKKNGAQSNSGADNVGKDNGSDKDASKSKSKNG